MDQYYSLKEVAERLSVHYNTVYRLVISGELKTVKVGDTHRVSESAIREFLEKKGGKQDAID